MTPDQSTREERANVRDDRANNRDDRASVRDGRADDREKGQHGALAWLFAVLVIIGMALTIAVVQSNRATNKLERQVDNLQPMIAMNQYSLDVGRYERIMFQREQRKLTCIDLEDSDTGATDTQYAECDVDKVMPLPPKPKPPKGTP